MRMKSELWVKAYLRTAAGRGAPGVVVRRGNEDAGAIFIKVLLRDRSALLFGPAPAGIDDADRERKWMPLLKGVPRPESDIDAMLDKEIRFDSDLWIIEIDSPDGAHHLDGWLLATPGGQL